MAISLLLYCMASLALKSVLHSAVAAAGADAVAGALLAATLAVLGLLATGAGVLAVVLLGALACSPPQALKPKPNVKPSDSFNQNKCCT